MKLQFLVIHCTATPSGMKVTPDDIKRWHTMPVAQGGRGWRQVGYSDMILLDGTLVNLVPYDEDDNVEKWEITNGVAGINSYSRHVVYVGGGSTTPKDTRTPAQSEMLADYVHKTIAKHPTIKVAGHNQFTNMKACPSFNVPAWLRLIGVAEKNIYKPAALV